MEFDPENPLQKRRHSSNRAFEQIQNYNLEVGFMAARGYSKQQKFIGIKSIAISHIEENKHKVRDVTDFVVTELQILEGLRWRLQSVTAIRPITFMSYLLPLLKTDSQQQLLPITPVSQIIVTIQRESKLSTLAGSAILVTSYKLLPELHPPILWKSEVVQRFDELKEHVIADALEMKLAGQ